MRVLRADDERARRLPGWGIRRGGGDGYCVVSSFDSISRDRLREVLLERVRDGVLVRLIGKWLKAGVMEGGVVYHPDSGTPQGGVVSPVLANVFLHEVLDVWFERVVRPRLRGKASLVRYAPGARQE